MERFGWLPLLFKDGRPHIYEPAAPVPDVTPSPDRNQFLREVIDEIDSAAHDVGAILQ